MSDRYDDNRVPPTEGAPPRTERVVDPYAREAAADARLTAVEARQGWYGRPVLYVLVAALVLAAIYLIGTTFWAAEEIDGPAGSDVTIENNAPAAAPPPATDSAPAAEVAPDAGAPNSQTDAAPPPASDPAPAPADPAPAPAPTDTTPAPAPAP